MHLQFREVDPFQAARVHRGHLVPMALASGERLDPAPFAKKVIDRFFSKLVVGEVIFPLLELERVLGDERKHRPRTATDRAVAGDHRFCEVERDRVSDGTAMTGTLVFFFGHGILHIHDSHLLQRVSAQREEGS
jgi:hypothetical protein